MSVLIMDSVDHYTTAAQLDEKWSSESLITTINTTGGRFGGGAVELDSSSEQITFVVSDLTTVVMGGAISLQNPNKIMDSLNVLLEFAETGVVVNITVGNHLGRVRVKLGGGGGTTLGTSTQQVFRADVFHYLEAKVILGEPSSGSVEVHVDGVQVLNLTGIDTINGGAGVIDRCIFRGQHNVNAFWDDMYIDTVNILGDSRCDLIMPDGDGNYTEFGTTVGSGTHALNVDEIPPDDDTTYNEGTAVNQRDTFTMANLTAITTQTIHAVQQVNWAKHDGSATNHRLKLRISSNDFDGASQALASAYSYFREVYDQDPNASAAWVESVINGMESGYEEL